MTNINELTTNFERVKNRWVDAQNLQSHYDDLINSLKNNSISIIELCKSFLEMVCITIINELGEPVPLNGSSTTQYLGITLDKLGIRNTRGACAFDKILSGYNKIADGITDVRNNEGGVAHGRDGFFDIISERHIRVYLLATDTILGLLLDAYDGVDPNLLYTREPHKRFDHLNTRIDNCTTLDAEIDEDGILIVKLQAGTDKEGFDLMISPSELLYNLDRRAYIDILNSLSGVPAEVITEEVELEEINIIDKEIKDISIKQIEKEYKIVTSYDGKYSNQIYNLYEYIFHTSFNGKIEAANVQNLVYTLLKGMDVFAVVDWYKRDSILAAVRLLLKKCLKALSIDVENGDNVIEGIIKYLSDIIPGGSE